MKRLAAVAVMVAGFCCGAFAQHGGGSHGGGFSGGHAGFSGSAGGFAGHGGPAFHGGFSGPSGGFARMAPPGYAGTMRYAPRASSYPGIGRPGMPSAGSMHRGPYNSPYGRNRYGYGYRYPYNRFAYLNGWPWWGWGYPGYWPGLWDDSDSYDSQPAAQPPDYYNYPYQQPYPDNQQEYPYPPQPGNPQGPAGAQPYPQQPYPQQPYPQQPDPPQPDPPQANVWHAPSSGAQSKLPASEALTVMFKDGRPPEHVYNYILTPNTLTVLDQHRHDIPVDQIDLEATANVNIQAGIEFSLPVRTP